MVRQAKSLFYTVEPHLTNTLHKVKTKDSTLRIAVGFLPQGASLATARC